MKLTVKVAISVCLLFSIVFFIGSLVTDHLLDSFKRIERSLESSGRRIDTENVKLLNLIRSNSKNTQFLAGKVDSIYQLNQQINVFFDSIRVVLIKADPKGDNLEITNTILVKNNSYLFLIQEFEGLNKILASLKTSPDLIEKKELDTLIVKGVQCYANLKGLQKLFGSGIPTTASLTALSETRNDFLVRENSILKLICRKSKKSL